MCRKAPGGLADHLSGAALMPGRQYKLTDGLYGLIRGGLPIGGLSSPAPVILIFLWALCKVNGIRPDKRQLVRDREAHRRGVRRPVQRRGFRGLLHGADRPRLHRVHRRVCLQGLPGRLPGSERTPFFLPVRKLRRDRAIPLRLLESVALLAWLLQQPPYQGQTERLSPAVHKSQAPHAAYSIVVYPVGGTSAAACPTGPLDTGPFSRGPMDWPFPADAKGFQGRSSCLCDPVVPDVVCTSITYSLR